MKKRFFTTILAGVFSLAMLTSVYAGQWQEDATGSWYKQDDGSYPVSSWQWIDGDGNGVSECYYFGENGYCLKSTTAPDGSTVNETGAWIVDGVVQTQTVQATQPAQSSAAVSGGSTQNVSTVYTPASGGKFHKIPNCGRMNPDKAQSMTTQDAIGKGFEACDKCF